MFTCSKFGMSASLTIREITWANFVVAEMSTSRSELRSTCYDPRGVADYVPKVVIWYRIALVGPRIFQF